MGTKRIVVFIFMTLLLFAQSALAEYPYSYEQCPSPTCRNYCYGDKWNFCMNNCTSYAAWRLNNVYQNGDIVFHNYYKNVKWGNAGNWKAAAESVGIVVDKIPRIGSIAWFAVGHVAYVEQVNGDGTVNIAEYNYDNPCNRGIRYNQRADYYIHIFDSSAIGWVSASSLKVSPSTVVIGQTFSISFTLREVNNVSKTFENIAVAILDAGGNFLFDAYKRDQSLTIAANDAYSKTITTYLYPSRPTGTYKAILRAKLNGKWFDLDTTGNGVNPRSFTAVTQSASIPGDLNKDGKVNMNDFTILADNYGKSGCGNVADINGDCKVNINDVSILASHYGEGQ